MKKVSYQKIMVTLDGSPLAAAALAHALFLEENLNTKILLLSVVDPTGEALVALQPADLTPPVSMIGATAFEIAMQKKKTAQAYLQKIKKELEDAGAKSVAIYVAEGVAADEIIDVAKEEKVDLIIMSTHGLSGFRRTFVGSVADYVVRHASCPVLLIHPQEKK